MNAKMEIDIDAVVKEAKELNAILADYQADHQAKIKPLQERLKKLERLIDMEVAREGIEIAERIKKKYQR